MRLYFFYLSPLGSGSVDKFFLGSGLVRVSEQFLSYNLTVTVCEQNFYFRSLGLCFWFRIIGSGLVIYCR